jgi:hypothetical protein
MYFDAERECIQPITSDYEAAWAKREPWFKSIRDRFVAFGWDPESVPSPNRFQSQV